MFVGEPDWLAATTSTIPVIFITIVGCSGSLVVTVIVLVCFPFLPLVLKVALIVPVLPFLIAVSVVLTAVQPQLPFTFLISSSLIPMFLKENS